MNDSTSIKPVSRRENSISAKAVSRFGARQRPRFYSHSYGSRWTVPSGIAGEIASEIEHRLMTGQYRFGETLSATQLAEEFATSRQPISAAISHLRTNGYVEIIPQVGCRFVSPSPREISDTFFALGKTEGAVATLAAERYEADEGKLLVEIASGNRITSLDGIEQRERYIANIDAFHAQLRLMSRSPSLCDTIAAWSRLSKFYLWQSSPKIQPAAAKKLNAERMEIARAVCARDGERAGRLMEIHIMQKPGIVGITGR